MKLLSESLPVFEQDLNQKITQANKILEKLRRESQLPDLIIKFQEILQYAFCRYYINILR